MMVSSSNQEAIDPLSSPLITAIISGHAPLVLRLIGRSQYDFDQLQALHVASAYGKVDCLRILIENHANIEKEIKWRRTPLLVAVEEGHESIVAVLLGCRANHGHVDESKNSPLMYAAQRRRVSILSRLLLAGADPNLQNCLGYTALMHAAQAGEVRSVELLLHYGANPHIANQTALHLASNTAIASLLEQSMASYNNDT